MKIIGREKIKRFIRKHAKARAPLSAWLGEAEEAKWKAPQDVRKRYQSVDFLANNRVIFNIGGNNFRLVVLVRYASEIIVIERIGTHAEYSKWKLS